MGLAFDRSPSRESPRFEGLVNNGEVYYGSHSCNIFGGIAPYVANLRPSSFKVDGFSKPIKLEQTTADQCGWL
jgi:hypothetical protein